jgi:hypothetical protein
MSPFRMISRALLVTVALMCAMATANAQQPARIRGQIEKANGAMLMLKTREGATMQVRVADDARVSALEKASLSDIKPDTFIGIAGMPRPDGSIEAFSIHIFLPAQRGVVPDRHGPWDARPGSTMTNAYVEGMSTEKDGETLKVKYKDGEKVIHTNPQTVIAAAAKGDKSELKPGAQIIIFSYDKQPDGSVLAKTLYVGRGVTPAM